MRIAYLTLLVSIAGFVGCNTEHTSNVQTGPAAPLVSTSAPAPEAASSSWQVDTETNPVTGEVTTTAYLKYEDKQNIYVRRKGKKLECFINTGDFLETVDNEESRDSLVQYRFDAGKVTRQTWSISDSNEALFYPGNPRAFIAQMRRAKSLSVEYRPADKIPATVTFDVSGFPDVYDK